MAEALTINWLRVLQMPLAQFIAICNSSILVKTLGYAVSFSSPLRGKRCIFERCKPLLTDQLQPSTNSPAKGSEIALAPSPQNWT
jgi:hypothetical protein